MSAMQFAGGRLPYMVECTTLYHSWQVCVAEYALQSMHCRVCIAEYAMDWSVKTFWKVVPSWSQLSHCVLPTCPFAPSLLTLYSLTLSQSFNIDHALYITQMTTVHNITHSKHVRSKICWLSVQNIALCVTLSQRDVYHAPKTVCLTKVSVSQWPAINTNCKIQQHLLTHFAARQFTILHFCWTLS